MLNNIMGCRMVLASVIFVAVVGQVNGQDVGNCNLSIFTTGGQQCQRTMMLNLKNNSSLDCSDEYPKESSCLNDHVGSCLQGTGLSAFQSEIVKLLKLLLYHCGTLGFEPASINQIVLGFVQCDANDLNETVTCWDDFRSAFDVNRSDPSLCRKFAEGKQKCTNIAKKACPGICEYITKDAYNPFCDNTIDPADTSNLFDCIRSLGCSNKLIYENAVRCEKSSFEAFAKSSETTCSVELKNNKDCLRQNLVSQCSAMQEKEDIFEDVVKTLRATLMTQQFFCENVTLNKSSLHRLVTTADCKSKFFTDVETECAEPFRNIYLNAAEKKSADVCNAFAEAKKCLNKAHEDSCNFALSTRQAAEFDEDNPFCENGKDPQKSGASWAQVTTLPLFISSFVGLFASIP